MNDLFRRAFDYPVDEVATKKNTMMFGESRRRLAHTYRSNSQLLYSCACREAVIIGHLGRA